MRTAVVSIALAVALGSAAWASKLDWTGSAACGTCHPAHLAAWRATPHAKTAGRLGVKPDAKCLACHSTGEAPAGPLIAVEVGCESCHGAGAAYAADDLMRSPVVARALGLADTSTPAARAKICAQCHIRSTKKTPFDPTSPVHTIAKP